MKRRMILTIAIVAMLVLIAACQSYAVGKYCLAFWRETGYYEKGGTGGMHVLNVHVWDENGNPCVNKQIKTDAGLSMGYTDSKGQLEIALYEPNSYPVKVVDGSNLSDVTPGFSTTRAPDWGHYCFEAGFLYKSDSANSGTFDLNYAGVFNSTAGQPCELSAPKTNSIAFCGTKPEMGYYCSDSMEIGSSVASVGQTFKATGNRVVACKVQVIGSFPMKYEARIREGGPTGTVIGSVAVSPDTGSYEYLKTLTKWGVSGVSVTPGNTYFLEITKNGGGNIQAYRVTNNNYADGCYYEGTTAFTGKELMGHVVCMSTSGSSVGAIAGTVKDSSNNAISGATVSTTSGGYSTTTNASGAYTLSNVSAGTYSVVASKTGYNSSTLTGQSVTAGATTTCNFTLTTVSSYGTIAGNVKDGGGVNVSGATVSTTTGGFSATTNSSGNYTISNVPVGTYDVVASKADYNSQTQTGKTVSANQTTTVNFTITAQTQPFSSIANKNFESGFNNDPDVDHQSGTYWHRFSVAGSSKAGGVYGTYHSANWSQTIYESSWTAGIYQQATSATVGNNYTASVWVRGGDSNLKFWVGIDPTGGTNATSANVQWSAESIPSTTWTQISKQVAAQSSTITMFIKAQNIAAINKYAYIDDADLVDDGAGTPTTGTLSGNVKDGGGVNVSGATVSTTTGSYTTTTDASGNYTLANVTAGTYSVVASKSGYNSQTQTGKVVTAGATTTCSFTITRQTGTIAGNVKDGGGVNVSGATVSTTTGGYTTTTDSSGNYTLANVATGTYDVVASKSGYNSQTQAGKTVNNAATTTVNFTIIRQTGTIAGNVKDGGGVNVSGATVSTTTGGYTTTTDASGNYTLSNVVTGTYDVVASKSGYNSQTQAGKVVSNAATTTVNFTITRQTGTIAGNVKDGGGLNVSGATVSTTTGGYTTTTDSSGNYTLTNVATGTYDVVASKTGYNSQTQAGKSVTNGATTTVNFTITAQGSIASESFDTLPSWTSTFDASWGSAASFTSVTGGQSGNFMQASRSSQGSSARVKVYTVPQNTSITISCYMKCPSYANSYWMEFACRLGSYTASNFDSDSGNWTMIKKFSNTGTNGNGNTWTQYSTTINTGSNTQISIGYKHGASGNNGPTVGWDTFVIQ